MRGKGVCVPLLSAVLAATPNHLILVELKGGDGLVEEVIRVVRAAGAEQRFIAASFKPGLMKAFRQAAPEIRNLFRYCGSPAAAACASIALPGWPIRPQRQVLSFSHRFGRALLPGGGGLSSRFAPKAFMSAGAYPEPSAARWSTGEGSASTVS